MSEVALKGASAPAAASASRAAVLRRLRLTDSIFHGLTRGASLAVLALLSGVIIALIYGAAPALGTFGFGFLFDESWNPVTENRLATFPEVIADAARDYAPQTIAFYLKDLAADFHSYYNAERILVEDEAQRLARLALIAAVRQVLRNGLAILGVSAPESM